MAEWGRKEYSKAWPSRTPVWTWTAFCFTLPVLRRDADAGVRAELDGGGAAVPVGLPEERSAGQSVGDGAVKYTLLEAVVGQVRVRRSGS